jgi:hypothetical protein
MAGFASLSKGKCTLFTNSRVNKLFEHMTIRFVEDADIFHLRSFERQAKVYWIIINLFLHFFGSSLCVRLFS